MKDVVGAEVGENASGTGAVRVGSSPSSTAPTMAASSSKSEQSYIRSALVATPPLRADGRALLDFRPIALQTRVAPLANGSARVSIGGTGLGGVGGGPVGTEVLAAVKLEVEDIVNGKGVDGGRVECYVSWYKFFH